jgi:hypothetical protein
VIESWSGYFRPTDPTGKDTLDVGSDADNAYASVHVLATKLAKQIRRSSPFFAFYIGASDPTFVADNKTLDRELSAAKLTHVFAVYPGGHTTALWASHATRWLAMALNHLQRRRRHSRMHTVQRAQPRRRERPQPRSRFPPQRRARRDRSHRR